MPLMQPNSVQSSTQENIFLVTPNTNPSQAAYLRAQYAIDALNNAFHDSSRLHLGPTGRRHTPSHRSRRKKQRQDQTLLGVAAQFDHQTPNAYPGVLVAKDGGQQFQGENASAGDGVDATQTQTVDLIAVGTQFRR